MPNSNKEYVLEFLRKHAPLAPLAECLNIVNDIDSLHKDNYYLKCIIAILASNLLTDNGEVKPEFVEGRPAWQLALKEVQRCHAWVVCGPVSDSMEKLLTEFDAKNK